MHTASPLKRLPQGLRTRVDPPPAHRVARRHLEFHLDDETHALEPGMARHLDEVRRGAAERRRGVGRQARVVEAARVELDVAEALLAADEAFADAAQVEPLHLPRLVVAPVAAPHETELAGGPFAVRR